MPRRAATALFTALLMGAGPPAIAGPHVHGEGRLDIAVEGAGVTLLLRMPMESLVGFERAPRTDDERARVAAALARLREPARLFTFDAAAGCTPAGAPDLHAPVIGLAPAGGVATTGSRDGHADLDATLRFACTTPGSLREVKHALFEAFPRLSRLVVQVAGAKGQAKAVLRRPAAVIALQK
jgi:hypothetical protein